MNNKLHRQKISRNDFEGILRSRFSQTEFNGLNISNAYEYQCETDNRVLRMRVTSIRRNDRGRPILTYARVEQMYISVPKHK